MVVYSMSSAETVSRIEHRFSNETRRVGRHLARDNCLSPAR